MSINRFNWLDENGHKVLYIDLSDLNKIDLLTYVKMTHDEIVKSSFESIVVIADIKNTSFDKNTATAFEEVAQKNKPYIKASAMVNAGEFQKLAIKTIGKLTKRKFEFIASKDLIEEWLNKLTK